MRVDVWLWRARFFKTRAEASAFVAKGRVRVSRPGRPAASVKPSFTLALGDVVVFVRHGRVASARVQAMGTRRGPPSEARGLYALAGEDPPTRDALADDDMQE